MDSILDQAQLSLLNAIGENIFICDEQYQIIMLNDYSNHLIKKLEPFTGLSSKEEYISARVFAN